jgi:hypothetical protein
MTQLERKEKIYFWVQGSTKSKTSLCSEIFIKRYFFWKINDDDIFGSNTNNCLAYTTSFTKKIVWSAVLLWLSFIAKRGKYSKIKNIKKN